MVSLAAKVETGHRDIVHDAQINYHGTRLATCSSDHFVKIFGIHPNGQTYPIAELSGHDGPVWQVNWAHHPTQNILASCSHDRKAIVWLEVNEKWQKSYEYNQHDASVNSISWAPYGENLIFACCSTDCGISIIQFMGDVWKPIRIPKAHDEGCNAVSWAPIKRTDSVINPTVKYDQKRIASGGNDKLIKIWKEESPDNWIVEATLEGHTDWVRDVAWAPSESLTYSTIASCGMDGRVIIWRCTNLEDGNWSSRVLRRFDEVLWNVSWSLCASVLAVCGADNKVYLFQERLPNQWVEISQSEEDK